MPFCFWFFVQPELSLWKPLGCSLCLQRAEIFKKCGNMWAFFFFLLDCSFSGSFWLKGSCPSVLQYSLNNSLNISLIFLPVCSFFSLKLQLFWQIDTLLFPWALSGRFPQLNLSTTWTSSANIARTRALSWFLSVPFVWHPVLVS